MCAHRNDIEVRPHDCAEAHHVLALVAMNDDDIFASGSAVLVAPHLALTARHVTDDFHLRYQGIPTQTNGSTNFSILARCDFGGAWRMLRVVQTFNTAGTDVTALYVTPMDGEESDFPWPRITLDLLPPPRQSRVFS